MKTALLFSLLVCVVAGPTSAEARDQVRRFRDTNEMTGEQFSNRRSAADIQRMCDSALFGTIHSALANHETNVGNISALFQTHLQKWAPFASDEQNGDKFSYRYMNRRTYSDDVLPILFRENSRGELRVAFQSHVSAWGSYDFSGAFEKKDGIRWTLIKNNPSNWSTGAREVRFIDTSRYLGGPFGFFEITERERYTRIFDFFKVDGRPMAKVREKIREITHHLGFDHLGRPKTEKGYFVEDIELIVPDAQAETRILRNMKTRQQVALVPTGAYVRCLHEALVKQYGEPSIR